MWPSPIVVRPTRLPNLAKKALNFNAAGSFGPASARARFSTAQRPTGVVRRRRWGPSACPVTREQPLDPHLVFLRM